MSDTIGPVHIKEHSGSEMQSRIDAEVCVRNLELYDTAMIQFKEVIYITGCAGGKASKRSI